MIVHCHVHYQRVILMGIGCRQPTLEAFNFWHFEAFSHSFFSPLIITVTGAQGSRCVLRWLEEEATSKLPNACFSRCAEGKGQVTIPTRETMNRNLKKISHSFNVFHVLVPSLDMT